MQEALKHLADQPALWPRWKRGYRYDPKHSKNMAGTVPTTDKHLFVFVRQNDVFYGQFGVIYPACHFIGGADRILYDNERRLTTSDEDPLCSQCWEAELQHALAESDS